MPVAGGDGGATRGGRGGRKNSPIIIHNPATGQTTSVSPVKPSGNPVAPVRTSPLQGGTKTSSASASKGGTKKEPDAQDKYLAQQKKDKAKAAQRYITDAENMQGQANALRAAIGPKGQFRRALDQRLENIDLLTGQQLDQVEKGYEARKGSLDADALNNDIAAGDSSGFNDRNRIRERTMALAEIAAQGGGESDGLRAQLMSLRSWEANQGEVNRSFHDSQRSINAARTDLDIDTQTARANIVSEANADRGQLWNEYYAQNAESFTQLGNTLGQQAEYYGLAAEQGAGLGGGKGKGKGKGKGQKDDDKGGKGKGKGGPSNTGPGRDGGINTRPVLGASTGNTGGLAQPQGQGGGYVPGRGGEDFDLTFGGGRGGGGGGGGGGRDGIRPHRLPKIPKNGNLQETAAAKSDRAFMQATNWMGRAYKDPGLGDLADWQPAVHEVKQLASSNLLNARTTVAQAAPEGATLRKW